MTDAHDGDQKVSKRPGERYWAAVVPILDSISIYDGPEIFLSQFTSVQIGPGHLFAAHWCQSEICNGGFHQFLPIRRGFSRLRPPKDSRPSECRNARNYSIKQ